ncbi:MAG: hypothetical protein EPN82_09730 [Bacteroidetes bacterium]|nr:MAG: hypothetical protein EPN82_09730 [Bacteroidota bacterium]
MKKNIVFLFLKAIITFCIICLNAFFFGCATSPYGLGEISFYEKPKSINSEKYNLSIQALNYTYRYEQGWSQNTQVVTPVEGNIFMILYIEVYNNTDSTQDFDLGSIAVKDSLNNIVSPISFFMKSIMPNTWAAPKITSISSKDMNERALLYSVPKDFIPKKIISPLGEISL